MKSPSITDDSLAAIIDRADNYRLRRGDRFSRTCAGRASLDREILAEMLVTAGGSDDFRALLEDAANWRALRDCARITSMGCAGCEPGGESFDGPTAHVTLNFWTHNVRETEEYPRQWLDMFVKKARRVPK
jgi:hypothetical protein